jgi:aspartyl-tRNA(Asn)/glutamyl-tRNA(Gln) amidotransferase subunit A
MRLKRRKSFMVYIDDSIMQKGKIASAGSKYLENFVAPFDATVVTRLGEDTKRVVLGEFGLDLPNTPDNPLKVPMLLNDALGVLHATTMLEENYCIRPTYGTVSRFGLIPTAASMDQIGVVCENLDQGFNILSRIAGKDEKDGAMFPQTSYDYAKKEGSLRFAVPEGIELPEANKLGAVSVKLPYYDEYVDVFYILAYSEISNNISRYDGVKFGRRAEDYSGLGEMYVKSRSEGFGPATKKAAVMGCLMLSEGYYEKYYVQAMKIRRLIKESLRFDEYDVLVLPAGHPLAVLAGLPSITFGDVELVANVCCEGTLRAAWEVLGL